MAKAIYMTHAQARTVWRALSYSPVQTDMDKHMAGLIEREFNLDTDWNGDDRTPDELGFLEIWFVVHRTDHKLAVHGIAQARLVYDMLASGGARMLSVRP